MSSFSSCTTTPSILHEFLCTSLSMEFFLCSLYIGNFFFQKSLEITFDASRVGSPVNPIELKNCWEILLMLALSVFSLHLILSPPFSQSILVLKQVPHVGGWSASSILTTFPPRITLRELCTFFSISTSIYLSIVTRFSTLWWPMALMSTTKAL